MRKDITLEELRKIQLDMMKAIHQFCIDNNIRYSLGGGTLLGAVRHKGFIPWDDDIDIMMPRPDYEKFIHSFNGYDKNLVCEAIETTKKHIYPFAKVYNNRTVLKEKTKKAISGVYIDVFPIDGYPEDMETKRKHIKKIYYINFFILIKNHELKLRWRNILVKTFFSLIPYRLLLNIAQKSLLKYPFETSSHQGAVCGIYGEKECYESSVFSDYIELSFEGYKFSAIKEYDVYLRKHYGNYMELPPVSKRVGGHIEYVYYK